jgi:STAS-like domain of unknown function (DUF4325)
MTTTLKIHDIVAKRALVARESAWPIRDALGHTGVAEQIALDFSGVDAVTPSFVDELLTILAASVNAGNGEFSVLVVNPPTRLSAKFAAVARAHAMSIRELDTGSWELTSLVGD